MAFPARWNPRDPHHQHLRPNALPSPPDRALPGKKSRAAPVKPQGVRQPDNRGSATPAYDMEALGFENSLLVGGAASAGGLYVGRVGMRLMYRGLRAGMDKLLNWKQVEATEYSVVRSFLPVMCNAVPQVNTYIVARDTAFGGALMLLPRGIFYLAAPSYTVYEFNYSAEVTANAVAGSHTGAAANGAGAKNVSCETTPIYLLPHAYYLYRKAMCWLDANSVPQASAKNLAEPEVAEALRLRFESFAADCLLHMLLNDAKHAADSRRRASHNTPPSPDNTGLAMFKPLLQSIMPRYRKPSAGIANQIKSWLPWPSVSSTGTPSTPERDDSTMCTVPQESLAHLKTWIQKIDQNDLTNFVACMNKVQSAREGEIYFKAQSKTLQGAKDTGIMRLGCGWSIPGVSHFQVFVEVTDTAAAAAAQAGKGGAAAEPRYDATSRYFLENHATRVGRLRYSITQ